MKILEKIPLAQYTTLKIGGNAKYFVEAEDEKDILAAVKFAHEKNLPVFVLGGGSNVLVSDNGFNGLVIKILNTKYQILNTKIECGAGAQLAKVVNETVKAGLTGLEWAAGIPGTIGGAVRGNAGCFGSDMSQVVESVKVINTKELDNSQTELGIMNYESGSCMFDYRDSVFKQNPNLIILSATLKLKKGDREESEKIMRENMEKRKIAQPAIPCPGSFFKNPIVKDQKLIAQFETDTGKKFMDEKIPSGYLIDEAGLKGKKVGGAMVSREHANFIVNTGGATAEDVIMLAAIVKTRVRNKFGIQLKEEVQMVGF